MRSGSAFDRAHLLAEYVQAGKALTHRGPQVSFAAQDASLDQLIEIT
jgi:hypothetical protein